MRHFHSAHLPPVRLLIATGITVQDILHREPRRTDGRYTSSILLPCWSHVCKAHPSASCARFNYQQLLLPPYRFWVLYILMSTTEECSEAYILIIFVTIEFCNVSIPALGLTKSPIQCESEALFPGVKLLGREIKRLRKHGTVPLLPHISSRRAQGSLTSPF
jgi:hypothetical protein